MARKIAIVKKSPNVIPDGINTQETQPLIRKEIKKVYTLDNFLDDILMLWGNFLNDVRADWKELRTIKTFYNTMAVYFGFMWVLSIATVIYTGVVLSPDFYWGFVVSLIIAGVAYVFYNQSYEYFLLWSSFRNLWMVLSVLSGILVIAGLVLMSGYY